MPSNTLCAAAALTLAGPLAGAMAAVGVVEVVERATAGASTAGARPIDQRERGRAAGARHKNWPGFS